MSDFNRTWKGCHRSRAQQRSGKILVILAIALPTLCGLIGLVVDGGLLFASARQLQHICDSAATAAAKEKQLGKSNEEARAVAESIIREQNQLTTAFITLHCPPTTGPYAGSSNHVEVILADASQTYFIHVLGGGTLRSISARAVAGFEASTTDSAIIILDPDPPPFAVAPVPTLPLGTLPAIVGGLEVLGNGTARVNGAVLVNTEWGGVDEHGEPVGESTGAGGLTHAVSATPFANFSRLLARDLRVVGGVDDPNNYGALTSTDPSPLKAGRLPVPDPFEDLPVPIISVDSENITDVLRGQVAISQLPLLSPPVRLQPGVYEWIEITSGVVIFEPGVYVVRNINPVSQLAINIVAGQVQANGVMFYITDSAEYLPSSGAPDSSDFESAPPTGSASALPSCAVINLGLLGSSFSGLDDPDSPFHQILIYQRRHDRRPILLVQENLVGPGQLQGTVYSKWGHVVLAGRGTVDGRFVVGTMRLLTLLDLEIQPSTTLPPAYDVYLVE